MKRNIKINQDNMLFFGYYFCINDYNGEYDKNVYNIILSTIDNRFVYYTDYFDEDKYNISKKDSKLTDEQLKSFCTKKILNINSEFKKFLEDNNIKFTYFHDESIIDIQSRSFDIFISNIEELNIVLKKYFNLEIDKNEISFEN